MADIHVIETGERFTIEQCLLSALEDQGEMAEVAVVWKDKNGEWHTCIAGDAMSVESLHFLGVIVQRRAMRNQDSEAEDRVPGSAA